jgi:hypothetical protein
VTRYFSISRSISSGCQRSISTAVCPNWTEFATKFSTAVWYSGEPQMCTWSSNGVRPKMPKNHVAAGGTSSGSAPVSGRRTPFGRPVVPDVYSIGDPAVRTDGLPTSSAPSDDSGANPSMDPTANPGTSVRANASSAVAAKRSSATNALAPLSSMRYATSAPTRCQFAITTYSPVWNAPK